MGGDDEGGRERRGSLCAWGGCHGDEVIWDYAGQIPFGRPMKGGTGGREINAAATAPETHTGHGGGLFHHCLHRQHARGAACLVPRYGLVEEGHDLVVQRGVRFVAFGGAHVVGVHRVDGGDVDLPFLPTLDLLRLLGEGEPPGLRLRHLLLLRLLLLLRARFHCRSAQEARRHAGRGQSRPDLGRDAQGLLRAEPH